MNSALINDLIKARDRLKKIQDDVTDIGKDYQTRELKWLNSQNCLTLFDNKDESVILNIGGEIYQISKSTLKKCKGSLFEYLIDSNEFDLSNEIFIDRNPKYFDLIIEYIRGNPIDYNYNFKSKQEIVLFKREADFYELREISEYIEARMKPIELVGMSFSGEYTFSDIVIGTNKVEDINNPNCLTGICTSAPGWIAIQINEEVEIEEIQFGGYKGNPDLWSPENGAGSEVLVAMNQNEWRSVGVVPAGFGESNMTLKFHKIKLRYIMLKSVSYIGLGYIRIIKCENIFDQ